MQKNEIEAGLRTRINAKKQLLTLFTSEAAGFSFAYSIVCSLVHSLILQPGIGFCL